MSAEGLAGAARRSLLLSFLQRYGTMALRLVSMVVLARLLTPEEYGAFAAAAAAVALAGVLTDAGVHQHLVQAASPGLALRRAAVGLGLAIALLALGLLGAALLLLPEGWIAAEARHAAAVLALTLLFQPFATVSSALLQREMRFGPVMWSGLAGAATLAATSIALAALGLGALALAIASVLEVAVATALLLCWQGAARPSFSGWRQILAFGWVWAAIGGARQLADALARLAVGGLLGLGALGLLSRAQAVVQLFDRGLMDVISPVALPAAAAQRRAGRELAPAYLRQVACLAAVAWPFFAAAALLAEPLVLLLLGRGWIEAVPAVRILAAGGLFLPLAALVLPYLVAIGELRRFLPVQLWLQAGRLLGVAAACLVSLELAVAVLAAEMLAKGLASQWLLARLLGYGWRDLGRVLGAALAPALAGAVPGVAAGLALQASGAPPWLVLPAAALAGGLPWLLCLFLLDHPLASELRRLGAAGLAWLNRRRAWRAPPDAALSTGRTDR